jgi:hypothetical protein
MLFLPLNRSYPSIPKKQNRNYQETIKKQNGKNSSKFIEPIGSFKSIHTDLLPEGNNR